MKDKALRRALGIEDKTDMYFRGGNGGVICSSFEDVLKMSKGTFGHLPSMANDIRELLKVISDITDGGQSIVACDKCKCLIRKCVAIAGEDRIEIVASDYNMVKEKQIVTPYYCHRCAPKKKGAKK